MYYIGLDLHSSITQMSVLNAKGKEKKARRFPTSEKEIRNAMEESKHDKSDVFVANFGCGFVTLSFVCENLFYPCHLCSIQVFTNPINLINQATTFAMFAR